MKKVLCSSIALAAVFGVSGCSTQSSTTATVATTTQAPKSTPQVDGLFGYRGADPVDLIVPSHGTSKSSETFKLYVNPLVSLGQIVTIDYGDGSQPSVFHTSSTLWDHALFHTYEKPGVYTVTTHINVSGEKNGSGTFAYGSFQKTASILVSAAPVTETPTPTTMVHSDGNTESSAPQTTVSTTAVVLDDKTDTPGSVSRDPLVVEQTLKGTKTVATISQKLFAHNHDHAALLHPVVSSVGQATAFSLINNPYEPFNPDTTIQLNFGDSTLPLVAPASDPLWSQPISHTYLHPGLYTVTWSSQDATLSVQTFHSFVYVVSSDEQLYAMNQLFIDGALAPGSDTHTSPTSQTAAPSTDVSSATSTTYTSPQTSSWISSLLSKDESSKQIVSKDESSKQTSSWISSLLSKDESSK